ncbi:phosphatase PAP2 family protein [bacterium D16-51]|nr:phosphatase PAP2 family protein [bacterium D16-59]RKI62846.1 phosphatase PAP2 family protein [bacterium D16-51]
MKKETYELIFQKVQILPGGVRIVQAVGKVLTYTAALVYLMAVGRKVYCREKEAAALLTAVPAVSFLLVSAFRKYYNAKRPYELYGFVPLIKKETKGKSFPSRHVFSIFVIGSSVIWFYPAAGALVCLSGCLLAAIRVVTGVHFPKDVLAGALAGILCGCIAGELYYLLV